MEPPVAASRSALPGPPKRPRRGRALVPLLMLLTLDLLAIGLVVAVPTVRTPAPETIARAFLDDLQIGAAALPPPDADEIGYGRAWSRVRPGSGVAADASAFVRAGEERVARHGFIEGHEVGPMDVRGARATQSGALHHGGFREGPTDLPFEIVLEREDRDWKVVEFRVGGR